MGDSKVVKGSCLCGAISYEVAKFEPNMGHCHCSMCRKFHGAAFSSYGEVTKENFKWLKGKKLLETYIANNGTERQFCKKCGSSLSFKAASDEILEISLASLDENAPFDIDAHIFTESKVGWYEINDSLKVYKQGRT